MLIKIFDSGTSNGQAPVNYLLGDKNHTGKLRTETPEVIEGDAQTTINLINSMDRKLKYTSGVIAFRNDEKPTDKQIAEILKDFKTTFFAGLDKNNFDMLVVAHREIGKGLELHFVVPKLEIQSGKKLNISPPGKRNQDFFNIFCKCQNQKHGWNQVVGDPLKTAQSGFETKSPNGADDKKVKSYLAEKIRNHILNGKLENRDQLITFLSNHKCEITRVGSDYLSVVLPGAIKARRFKGAMFSEGANYADLIQQHHDSKMPQQLSATEYQLQLGKLATFTDERKAFNTQAYLTTKTSFRRPRSMAKVAITKVNEVKEFIKSAQPTQEQLFQPAFKVANNIDVKQNATKIRSKATTSGSGVINSSGGGAIAIAMKQGHLNSQLQSLYARIASETDTAKLAELTAQAWAIKLQLEKLGKDYQDAIAQESKQYVKKHIPK